MEELFNQLQSIQELEKKAYQFGWEAGYKTKEKELLKEAEKDVALEAQAEASFDMAKNNN